MTSLGVGGGIFFSFPPPPRLGRASTRAFFGLRGGAVLVACNSWTSLGVRGPGLPPYIDWVVHARYHLPIQFSILNYNFKFKCQIKSSNGRSVRGQCSESYNWNFKLQFISNTLLLKFNSTVTSSYVLCLLTQLAMSISP
jgi:hypothetical protein